LLLRINYLGGWSSIRFNLLLESDGVDLAASNCQRLSLRLSRVIGVDLPVEDDQVRRLLSKRGATTALPESE